MFKKTCFAVNSGWKRGVHIQTCGHYLHFDCFKSYKDGLPVRSTPNAISSAFYFCNYRHHQF